jgi:hypothetical protein
MIKNMSVIIESTTPAALRIGNVFYGSALLKCKTKTIKINVSNHLEQGTKYEFRTAYKCKAGFINMADSVTTPEDIITGWRKNSLVAIQVKNEHGTWRNVFTTKAGKWHSIDKAFLEILTVANIHSSFPDMADYKLWESINATSWEDKAFVQN